MEEKGLMARLGSARFCWREEVVALRLVSCLVQRPCLVWRLASGVRCVDCVDCVVLHGVDHGRLPLEVRTATFNAEPFGSLASSRGSGALTGRLGRLGDLLPHFRSLACQHPLAETGKEKLPTLTAQHCWSSATPSPSSTCA